jgi:hypothetical protein
MNNFCAQVQMKCEKVYKLRKPGETNRAQAWVKWLINVLKVFPRKPDTYV